MTVVFTVIGAVALLMVFIGLERAFAPQPGRIEERLMRYATRQSGVIDDDMDETTYQIAAARAITRPLNRAIQGRSFAEQIQADLRRADLTWRASEFLTLQAGLGLLLGLIGLLMVQNPIAPFGLGLLGIYAPRFWIKRRQSKRMKAFNDQLPDTISIIANSLRAGMSMLQSMETLAREGPHPTAIEYARVVREIGLGISPQDALLHFVDRMRSDDLDLMVTAILVQHEVGGNLSKILDTISHTIRERIKLKGEIKTITSQQRMGGMILAGMPVVAAGALSIFAPGYFRPMFDPPGPWTASLGVGALSIFFGWMVMRKIVDIEV
jgi:tight adherence protein B